MRVVHPYSLLFAAVAVVASAASAVVQETRSGLLNSLEVRQLVARAEPADHVRLSAHFTALGERYTGDAKWHVSMSRSFVGNASRQLGSGMSAHCKRLAELNIQSAATVRELAAFHETWSRGVAAALPPNTERFQGGAGAPAPTEKELTALAAKASTPAEHRALAEYFDTLARRYEVEAREHATLAGGLRGTRIEQAATIHSRLAALARDATKEATAAADMHKGLATIAR